MVVYEMLVTRGPLTGPIRLNQVTLRAPASAKVALHPCIRHLDRSGGATKRRDLVKVSRA